MQKLTAGIVGCGPRGHGHARAYAGLREAELIACVDIERAARENFAGRYALTHRHGAVGEMMRKAQPRLVHVVTPPATHRAVVDEVLEHRPAALLVEKPLALDPGDAYHIVDSCAAAGVPLFVNHQLRYFQPMRHLRRHVASGALGTVHTVRATTRCDLLEQGTHLFDLASYLLGDEFPATHVFAAAEGVQSDGPTVGAPAYIAGVAALGHDIRLYFECGSRAPSWPGSDNPWHQLGVEVTGDRGLAGISLNRGWWMLTENLRQHAEHVHETEDDPAQRQLIIDACRALDNPDRHSDAHPRGPQRTAMSLDLVFSAQRSALHGQWTAVDDRATTTELVRFRRQLAGSGRSR